MAARLRIAAAVLLLVVWSGGLSTPVATAAAERIDSAPFYAGLGDPESLKTTMDRRQAEAQQKIDELLAVKEPRTVENTLKVYDDVKIALNAVTGPSGLIAQVHPDERMRQTAGAAAESARALGADLVLNRAVYDALAAIDVSRADAQVKFYLERELRDFRLNGVDRDQATRERIGQLQRTLDAANQEFMRAIRANEKQITVASADELAGLPPDFIARLKPDASGALPISTDLSAVIPVLTFARNDDVRKRLFMEWQNIAYPANMATLDRILLTQHQIAQAIGFNTYADYDMADRMVGTAKAASEFIERVAAASKARAEREYEALLKRKRQDVPDAPVVNAWENAYYTELVRKANFDFDARSVRPYLPYEHVRDGVLEITSRLFGITYRPIKDAPVWHSSVEAYEALENDAVIGRIYLDTHRRPNKLNSSGLTTAVRPGLAGRSLPEAVLIMSVPGGEPGDPGLLSIEDVKTVFHEFGHVLAGILAGNGKWFGLGRPAERDFTETTAQMFEDWVWDPATLATFAKHHQTGEPIPLALVSQMRRANEFGKAIGPLGVRGQMVQARLSLALHDRDPKNVDSTAVLRDANQRYLPWPFVEGTHRQTSTTHLANRNYSAGYYTYMWSLVIAKDLFSKFDANDLLAPGVARRFREKVLAPGGSKPAAALVEDFLGRPFNASAWEAWLNRDPS
jgi:thimet oligopeptidase